MSRASRVIIFILLSLLCFGISKPTIFNVGNSLGKKEDDQKKIQFMYYLYSEVSPKFPIRILDVGTGLGYFIPKIRRMFEEWGYTVTVEGLDNFSIFRKWKESDWRFIEEADHGENEALAKEIEAKTGSKIWYLDIAKAHQTIPHKFDMVFFSAPYPNTQASDMAFIEGSLKMVKDEGIIFGRFHWEETDTARLFFAKQILDREGFTVSLMNTHGILPEGMYPLDGELTMVIKKKRWDKPEEASTGLSLGKIANEIFGRKAMEGAA